MNPVELNAHSFSHVGNVREDNQDSVDSAQSADGSVRVFVVADGMGGYEHGGIASALAAQTFVRTVFDSEDNLKPNRIDGTLKRAMQDANLKVNQESLRLQAKMGTTLTAACVIGHEVTIAHVGDSRAYLIRNGQATVITRDHTAVGELVRAKVISPDKVRTHSQRSVLNRCLGVSLIIQADISRITLQTGDVLLLCSDGMWSAIEDSHIAALVDPTQPAESLAEKLVTAAMEAGSDDNVSTWTICVQSVHGAVPESKNRRMGLFRGILGAV